jgi:hypothetical protein
MLGELDAIRHLNAAARRQNLERIVHIRDAPRRHDCIKVSAFWGRDSLGKRGEQVARPVRRFCSAQLRELRKQTEPFSLNAANFWHIGECVPIRIPPELADGSLSALLRLAPHHPETNSPTDHTNSF